MTDDELTELAVQITKCRRWGLPSIGMLLDDLDGEDGALRIESIHRKSGLIELKGHAEYGGFCSVYVRYAELSRFPPVLTDPETVYRIIQRLPVEKRRTLTPRPAGFQVPFGAIVARLFLDLCPSPKEI